MTTALIIAGVACFPIGTMVAAYFAAGPAERLPNHRKNPETRR